MSHYFSTKKRYHIEVQCPVCKKWRWLLRASTLSNRFTGMCKSCSMKPENHRRKAALRSKASAERTESVQNCGCGDVGETHGFRYIRSAPDGTRLFRCRHCGKEELI